MLMFMYIYVCITVDLNSGPKLTGCVHNRVVLCLQVDGDRVISGSENSISVQLIQVRFYIHTLFSLLLKTYVCTLQMYLFMHIV